MKLSTYTTMGIIITFYLGGWLIVFIKHILGIRKCLYCKKNIHPECKHTLLNIILNPHGIRDIPVFHSGTRITHCKLYKLTPEKREELKRLIAELDQNYL